MATITVAAFAIFLLGAAVALAVAAARRLALAAVGLSLALAVISAGSAIAGQRRYDNCVQRAAQIAPDDVRDRLDILGYEAKRAQAADARADCRRGETLGVHDPF